MRSILFSIILTLAVPFDVQGAVITIPSDYAAIQEGIDHAAADDTVLVSPGTYTENIRFNGKSILLKSTDGPASTIIDGALGPDPDYPCVVTFADGEDRNSILDGFTLINGHGSETKITGGGITCAYTSPTIRNCLVTGNTSPRGGGICLYSSSAVISNSTFSNNQSDDGGGGLYCGSSDVEIRNCNFDGNTADSGGGAFFDWNTKIEITGCNFRNNTATNNGGAGFYSVSGTLTNCSFSGNNVTGNSGGVYLGSSSVQVNNTSVTQNYAEGNGGGLTITFGNILLMNCLIANNEADDGGGIVFHQSRTSVKLIHCVISENKTHNYAGEGGGLNINYANVSIFNCLFYGNWGGIGGGIYCEHTSPELQNCTFSNNFGRINNKGGAGFYAFSNCSPVIRNCIFWGDVTAGNVSPELDGESNVTFEVSHSDIQGGWEGEANIDADPQFVQGMTGGFYLSQASAGQPATSPCVDTGDRSASQTCIAFQDSSTCLDSFTTRTDMNLDSGMVDMGFHYPASTVSGSMELILSNTLLSQGDEFYLHYYINNTGDQTFTADVWIILDVYGNYWCYPGWKNLETGVDFKPNLTVSPGIHSFHEDVLRFFWPENAGAADGLKFYGALFISGTFELIGNIETIDWGYM